MDLPLDGSGYIVPWQCVLKINVFVMSSSYSDICRLFREGSDQLILLLLLRIFTFSTLTIIRVSAFNSTVPEAFF